MRCEVAACPANSHGRHFRRAPNWDHFVERSPGATEQEALVQVVDMLATTLPPIWHSRYTFGPVGQCETDAPLKGFVVPTRNILPAKDGRKGVTPW